MVTVAGQGVKDRAMNRQETNRAEIRRRSFCPGCGCHYPVHGEHRADCTATTATRLRLVFTGKAS